MTAKVPTQICDALYGDITLSTPIAELIATAVVQRLRFVRLSNIDSVSMPGIANISRYEHAIGTAHLVQQLGFSRRLAREELLTLQAAALLHDSGIAAFGHLVEEALAYVGVQFNHETKWLLLTEAPTQTELGGSEGQVFCGRVSGLRRWARTTFGDECEHERLNEIVHLISGRGRWGACIAGSMDVDNLDNLVRIAFHMGLRVDASLPIRIARGIVDYGPGGAPLFAPDALPHVEEWSRLRRTVYTRLMLAPTDLSAKMMLLYATVHAYLHGDLEPNDYVWTLTDDQLIERLMASRHNEVHSTTESWLTSEYWPTIEPLWFEGNAPAFATVGQFAELLRSELDRECFAYRIADKRERSIVVNFAAGGHAVVGADPSRWLLAVCSRQQKPFSHEDTTRIATRAETFFKSRRIRSTLDKLGYSAPLLENA